MERNGGYVERLGQVIVVQIVVFASFSYVEGHADRMEDEIELAAEVLHGPVDEAFQIGHARGVGRHDDRAALLGQLVDRAHADRYGRVRQHDLGSLLNGAPGHFPCDGILVQGAENQPLLPFQQIVRHIS